MGLRFPWESPDEPAPPPDTPAAPIPPGSPPPPKRRGRRPDAARREAARDAAPTWSYHRLTAGGPAGEVAAFAGAARGAGVVPWRLDLDGVEEGVFALAISRPPASRSLDVQGCRILARQFRDRVAAHHARAAASVGVSRACPFDLHALLPVPEAVLDLGPTHPEALAWLREHWGTTDAPRRAAALEEPGPGRRLPRGHAVVGYGFYTVAGEAPRAAVVRLGVRWPGLRFALRSPPADG